MQTGQYNLTKVIVLTEGFLFVVALIWGYYINVNPFALISFNLKDILLAFAACLLLITINFISIRYLSKYINFFEIIKKSFTRVSNVFQDTNWYQAIIIGLISGTAEELFFRGILQEQFGIIFASLIFGLFHISDKETVNYGIYTVVVGFYLGGLYILTGNLLVPLLVHVINNILAIPYIKHYNKNL